MKEGRRIYLHLFATHRCGERIRRPSERERMCYEPSEIDSTVYDSKPTLAGLLNGIVTLVFPHSVPEM